MWRSSVCVCERLAFWIYSQIHMNSTLLNFPNYINKHLSIMTVKWSATMSTHMNDLKLGIKPFDERCRACMCMCDDDSKILMSSAPFIQIYNLLFQFVTMIEYENIERTYALSVFIQAKEYGINHRRTVTNDCYVANALGPRFTHLIQCNCRWSWMQRMTCSWNWLQNIVSFYDWEHPLLLLSEYIFSKIFPKNFLRYFIIIYIQSTLDLREWATREVVGK